MTEHINGLRKIVSHQETVSYSRDAELRGEIAELKRKIERRTRTVKTLISIDRPVW